MARTARNAALLVTPRCSCARVSRGSPRDGHPETFWPRHVTVGSGLGSAGRDPRCVSCEPGSIRGGRIGRRAVGGASSSPEKG